MRESVKGHTCIPIEVRTQKARLACVMAGSKAGQIDCRAGSAGNESPEAAGEGCAHLSAIKRIECASPYKAGSTLSIVCETSTEHTLFKFEISSGMHEIIN